MLTRTVKMKGVVIREKSGFVRNNYVQHAWARWKADPSFRYRTYVDPEREDLIAVVAFY